MHAVEDGQVAEEPPKKKRLSKQAWRVPVTPRQRFELIQMMVTGELVKGREEIKRFTRFKSALGIETIMEIAVNGDGRVNTIMARSTQPALHVLTLENVEFFLEIFIERLAMTPRQQVILQPLITLFEELLAGGDVEPNGLEEFDPSAEDWKP